MSRGNFFAVDVRCVAEAARAGLNPAVAYLLQAAGTGRDMAHTGWAAKAVEKYTSISRGRSKAAVASNIAAGLVEHVAKVPHPRYRLRPWAEVLAMRAEGLPRRGAARPINPVPLEPALAWLPISFVVGAGNETPPLERLRQAQDVRALMLAIALYGAQNLAEDAGIDRGVISKSYEGAVFAECDQFQLWKFEAATVTHAYGDKAAVAAIVGEPPMRETAEQRAARFAPFWSLLQTVEDCGALEWIPHLVEGDAASAELIHPLGWGGSDSIEDRLGAAAHRAAVLVARQHNMRWAADVDVDDPGSLDCHLVLAPRHQKNLRLVAIARMRYRAQTSAAAAWQATQHERSAAYLAAYGTFAEAVEGVSDRRGTLTNR